MARPTMLTNHDRSHLLERLQRLRPEAKAAWGTLDAPRVLCHIADQMRVALGDLPSRPVHTLATRTLLRFLVVNTGMPVPRGKIKTAPEMLNTQPASWDADLATCLALAERMGRGEANTVHPAFGPLSPKEWGRLSWKHIDHHLVQFGV